MSASSLWVTCGTFSHERCSAGPEIFLIRGISTSSTGPNFEKSTFGIGGMPMPPDGAAAAAGAGALVDLKKPVTSSRRMRPLRPEPLTFERSTPSSRANLRTDGEACGVPPAAAAGGVSAVGRRSDDAPAEAAEAGCAASGGGGDAAGAAPAAAASTRIRLPSETLSPSLTLISLTVPAAGDGTSIVALSDSSSTSGSSTATVSPGFTITLMTGTSLKSPMSGTFTSIVAMCVSPVLFVTRCAD